MPAGVAAVVEHDENGDRKGSQAGGGLEGVETVGEETRLVVGGYDHPDSPDLAVHGGTSPVREATERWSWLHTARRKSVSTWLQIWASPCSVAARSMSWWT